MSAGAQMTKRKTPILDRFPIETPQFFIVYYVLSLLNFSAICWILAKEKLTSWLHPVTRIRPGTEQALPLPRVTIESVFFTVTQTAAESGAPWRRRKPASCIFSYKTRISFITLIILSCSWGVRIFTHTPDYRIAAVEKWNHTDKLTCNKVLVFILYSGVLELV